MSHPELLSALLDGCAMIDEMQAEVDRRIALVHSVTRDNAAILKYLTSQSSFEDEAVQDDSMRDGVEKSTPTECAGSGVGKLNNASLESSDETTKFRRNSVKVPSYAVSPKLDILIVDDTHTFFFPTHTLAVTFISKFLYSSRSKIKSSFENTFYLYSNVFLF